MNEKPVKSLTRQRMKPSQEMLTDLGMINQWSSVTMLSQRKTGGWSSHHRSLVGGNDRWTWEKPNFLIFYLIEQ